MPIVGAAVWGDWCHYSPWDCLTRPCHTARYADQIAERQPQVPRAQVIATSGLQTANPFSTPPHTPPVGQSDGTGLARPPEPQKELRPCLLPPHAQAQRSQRETVLKAVAPEPWGRGAWGRGAMGQGCVGQERVGQGFHGAGVSWGRAAWGRGGWGRGAMGQGRVGQGQVEQGQVGQDPVSLHVSSWFPGTHPTFTNGSDPGLEAAPPLAWCFDCESGKYFLGKAKGMLLS